MNLNDSLKKFVSNRNTITIIGVVLCIVILYVGYNYRINQVTALSRMPYAGVTIQPNTRITDDMVSYMDVPKSFLKGSYYESKESIVGKFSKDDVMIAKGSLFYVDMLKDSNVNASAYGDIKNNYTVISYKVDVASTYANSFMPNEYVDVYMKTLDDNNKILYGKLIANVKVLNIKDSSGNAIFGNTETSSTPAYMLFALPEDFHLLFRKALYLQYSSDIVELVFVPNTKDLSEDDTPFIASKTLKEYIEKKTQFVNVNEILSSTANSVSENEN